MISLVAVVLERFFSRRERQALFRSWAGSASMWMKVSRFLAGLLSLDLNKQCLQGGNDIWGNGTHAPDDDCDATHSHGQLIAFRENATPDDDRSTNMTAVNASTWILEHTPVTFQVNLL